MSLPDFTVDIYQNEDLPEGSRDVNAVVTVTTSGPTSAAPATDMASARAAPSGSVSAAGSVRPASPAASGW